MTRIGRDSTTPGDIPLAGLAVVMGYANGKYGPGGVPPDAWTPAAVARFAKAGIPVAWIDVNGSAVGADILDVEPFDATTSQAVTWAKAKRAAHPAAYPGIIYCNRSTLTPLFNTMNAAGLQVVRDFRLWIATLDGTKTVADMTGVTAVQYAGTKLTGGHYDESVIYDDAWKAPAKPPPAAPHLVSVTATAKFSDGTTKAWTVQ